MSKETIEVKTAVSEVITPTMHNQIMSLTNTVNDKQKLIETLQSQVALLQENVKYERDSVNKIKEEYENKLQESEKKVVVTSKGERTILERDSWGEIIYGYKDKKEYVGFETVKSELREELKKELDKEQETTIDKLRKQNKDLDLKIVRLSSEVDALKLERKREEYRLDIALEDSDEQHAKEIFKIQRNYREERDETERKHNEVVEELNKQIKQLTEDLAAADLEFEEYKKLNFWGRVNSRIEDSKVRRTIRVMSLKIDGLKEEFKENDIHWGMSPSAAVEIVKKWFKIA